jgi:hypothetical protein
VRPAHSKLAAAFFALVALALASPAWAAPQLSLQKRIGLTTGDQWEPAVAADASGHIYALYPQYGRVPDCAECSVPTMLLVVSSDNGKTWQAPRVVLAAGSGQFDAQIVVDPADRHTVFAEELDKPALAVRGQSVYVAFNHEEEVWVAASQDGGRSFVPSRVNADSRPGWSLLGSATIDPAGNAYLAWASYSKAGGARGSVNLFVGKSADSGKTWSAKSVDTSSSAPGCEDEDCGEANLGAQIALTSDTDGTLYALWSAGRTPLGAQRIYFSSSTNGGENWLPRASVSSAPTSAEHAFPAIAAGNNGDVRIAWMDTRNDPYWNTYYRSSSNGGATWSDETRVSRYVPGYSYIKKAGFRFPFGDYFSIAIDNHGDTQIVWGEGLNYQSPGSIWHSSGR